MQKFRIYKLHRYRMIIKSSRVYFLQIFKKCQKFNKTTDRVNAMDPKTMKSCSFIQSPLLFWKKRSFDDTHINENGFQLKTISPASMHV